MCFHVSSIHVPVVFKSVKFQDSLISGLRIFSGELRHSVMKHLQLSVRNAKSSFRFVLRHASLLTLVRDDSEGDYKCDAEKTRRDQ
jgi:hypothetical protein